jgi:hypothetical protein
MGLTENADRWSAGQALRQQIFGAATKMILDVASVRPGSRVLDVAAGTVSKRMSTSWWIDQGLEDEVTRLVKNVPGVTDATTDVIPFGRMRI